jgi:hypothetical protein
MKEIILVFESVPEVMNIPRANVQTTAILGLSDGDVFKQYTAIYVELALDSEKPKVNMNGSDKIPLRVRFRRRCNEALRVYCRGHVSQYT